MRSLVAPFTVIGGRIATTNDPDTIARQKILNCLTTDPLERVAIPDYGAGINQLLFENIDSLLEADFKVDAINEMSSRISGVQVVDIRVRKTDESEALVRVLYKTPLSAVREATFRIAIPGQINEESPI